MDPEKEATENVAETSTNENVSETKVENAQAKPEAKTEAQSTDARDYDAELKARDDQIADLNKKIGEVTGQSKTAHAEREKLMLEIGKHLAERGEITKERDEAIASASQTLETMSKATRVVTDEKDDLAARLAAAEQQLETQNQLLTKQNVLTNEFPHLLRYADMIAPGNEDDVRKQCQKLAEIREADLTQQKAILGGGVTASPGSMPVVRPMAESDVESKEKALRDAAAKGDIAFQEEIQRQIEAFNSTRQ